MSFKYYEDPILGKGRAQVDTGSGGSGGVEYIGGYRITIAGGTISNDRYMPIESVTGNSVTMQAGHAYKVYATSTAITLNTETVPDGKFGLEGHLEIFVAGTGYVVTGSNVVLANALEPDAVNNCTVRFHDGLAIISVEDHVAGYIVVNGSTSGDGSLYYGISTSTNDYVAFDASLNGTVIPLAGATAAGEKHVVGNGYAETTLTGAVDCGTSKFTVANLGLNNVQVIGGTLTLGDAHIPSGSTVAVSGGGLAFERVNGSGIIDAGGSALFVPNTTAHVSGIITSNGRFNVYNNGYLYLTGTTHTKSYTTGNGGGITITGIGRAALENVLITGNTAVYGAGVYCTGSGLLSNCIISGNIASDRGAVYVSYAGKITIKGSTITDNTVSLAQVVVAYGGYTQHEELTIEDSVVDDVYLERNSMTMIGSCNIEKITGNTGSVILASGAILDLTGNTNATPIAPGGGIAFASGGATVLYSSGAVSGSYMMDNVTLPAGAKLTNTAVIDLNHVTYLRYSSGAHISGTTITNGLNSYIGGCLYMTDGKAATLSHVTVTGCTALAGDAFGLFTGASLTLSDCFITSNHGYYPIYMNGQYASEEKSNTLNLSNCHFDTNQGIVVYYKNNKINIAGSNQLGGTIVTGGGANDSATITISSGAILDLTDNSNDTPIAPGGGITFGANVTVINSAGTSVLLNNGSAGTCAVIKNDGTTE